jgi:hypothetical protein
MLRAATSPGAGAPDKRLFGATLTEAMRCANELADDDAEGEDDEDDGSSSSEDSEEDDSDDDDAAADRLEHESESEFLERYAAIARELAEKPRGGEEEDDDEEAFDRDDDAFDRAMAPTKGDGAQSVNAFQTWFSDWKKNGSSGLRTAALVDAAVAKRFDKTRGKRDE